MMYISQTATNYLRTLWLFVALLAIFVSCPAHPWTNKDGKTLEGDLLGIEEGNAVILRESDSKMYRIPITTLSLPDQQRIQKLQKDSKLLPFLSRPIPAALSESLKVHFAFGEKDHPGFDSSGNLPKLPPSKCKIEWERDGVINGAASFNGRNSILWTGKLLSLQNQPLTISLWIRTENAAEQEIISYGRETWGFALFTEGRTAGYTYRWGKGKKNMADVRNAQVTVTDGRWHHLCAVTDNDGNCSLWIDGRRAGKRAGMLMPSHPNYNGTIGAVSEMGSNVRRTRTTRPFHGLIDEFMIFDRPLTDLEISELYDRFRFLPASRVR